MTTATLRRMVDVSGLSLACAVAGSATQPALILLHGWPHSSALYDGVIDQLALDAYVIAFDLPDVGASRGAPASSEKHVLADLILCAAEKLGARSPIVAGLDVGGMIAFAAAREHAERIEGAIVMNTVIPGLDPWSKVITDPRIWHFAFHDIAGLPESLVMGRQRQYFDFFFDLLAKDKAAITDPLRDEMTAAYARPESLHAGFQWYRAMAKDAKRNAVVKRIDLPVLYLRGDADGRKIDDYTDGLRAAGAADLSGETIEGSGEYLPVEAPAQFIKAMKLFRRRVQEES
jgi:pimeloyl-ACP methyl ester carboxylesterase